MGITRSFAFIVAASFSALAMDRAEASIIYGVSGAAGNPSSLYLLNSNGSVASEVGPVLLSGTSTNLVISGIFYDNQNSTLYGVTNSTGAPAGTANSLVAINPNTGAASYVGSPGSLGVTLQAVTIAPNGNVYGYSKTGSEALYSVSLTNGVASKIGNSGLTGTSGDALAADSSGTLYFASGGVGGTLYTLNSSTGAATPGPTLSATAPYYAQIKGAVFDGSTLYAMNFNNGGQYQTDLTSIDTHTGQITNLGASQNAVIGLAIAPAVPEPSAWVLTMAVPAVLLIRTGLRRLCAEVA